MLGDEGMEFTPGEVKDFGVEWEGGFFQEFDLDRVRCIRVNEVVQSPLVIHQFGILHGEDGRVFQRPWGKVG